MCKQKVIKLKLFIPAGGASATPPLGPVLGQFGVNTVQFCNDFNNATSGLNLFFDEGDDDLSTFILVVDVHIHEDRTFKFFINKPPVSFLLRMLTGVKVGAPQTVAGTISLSEFIYLTQFKFSSRSLPSSAKMLKGTARSIGIKIVI
jgi:Ribosomal protein L11